MKWTISIFFITALYYSSAFGGTIDNDSNESKKSITDITSGKKELSIDKNITTDLLPKVKKTIPVNSIIMPKRPPITNTDKMTNIKYQESMQAYYDYKTRGFVHRSKVFEWQLYSSKLLFMIVLILVFSGVILSGLQFYAGYKELHNNIQKNSENTDFEVSMEGIKISSPVIGLIILALSLGFFYLYLVYIFPIEEIF